MKTLRIERIEPDRYELSIGIPNDQIIPISEIKGKDKAELLCETIQYICDYYERKGFDDCFQQGLMIQAVNNRKVKK